MTGIAVGVRLGAGDEGLADGTIVGFCDGREGESVGLLDGAPVPELCGTKLTGFEVGANVFGGIEGLMVGVVEGVDDTGRSDGCTGRFVGSRVGFELYGFVPGSNRIKRGVKDTCPPLPMAPSIATLPEPAAGRCRVAKPVC